jgi:hypothetical protein
MTIPAADDQTLTVEEVAIGQVARVSIPIRGEDFRKLENTFGGQTVLEQLIAQGIRKIRNTIEAHLGTVIYKGASRATGSAGTNAFATDQKPLADLRQILHDNGTPMNDGELSLIINTLSGANLRKVANLYKANEAGGADLLRNGELLNLYGFSIKESAGVAAHTKGAGASYVINNGNIAVGSTTLSIDGGTVNVTGFTAGDVITITDEPTAGKYVVKTGLTSASGDIVINQPGLRGAIVDGKAVTIGNSYTANVGFHRSAVELVMRPPAMPMGGDAAEDRMTVQDPTSGLVFEAAIYKGYGMNSLELVTFYQGKVWKPEFVATLLS